MQRLHLVAASDDYLLELELQRLCAELGRELGVAQVETLPSQATAEDLAVEICTPSLFAAQRLMLLEDVRPWLEVTAPPDSNPGVVAGDLVPLLRALENGLPEDFGLVMGAWCARKPKGALVELADGAGAFRWLPLPPAPKPWEDSTLSSEQRQVLHTVLDAHRGGLEITPPAEDLLLERLGFAPRLLAAEVDKLCAAGAQGVVDEELVRRLVFPRERSLEVVRDAVLERDLTSLLDLVAAAAAGLPVNDWQGRRVEPGSLAIILLSQISKLLEQLLYLHTLCDGTLREALDPRRTAGAGWYNRVFKRSLAPTLEQRLAELDSNPLRAGRKAPSTWTLGQLFQAASRYSEGQLISALASAGPVERQLRSPAALEALSAWLTDSFGGYNQGA